jgi:L-threonylcarbamoyladenylate synthase
MSVNTNIQDTLPPLPPMDKVVETHIRKVDPSAFTFPDGILSDAVTCTDSKSEQARDEAAKLLQAGAPVAMPTETVYGLAANALDAEAVRSVFLAKGRPGDNPLIVHISSLAMLAQVVSAWTGPEDEPSTNVHVTLDGAKPVASSVEADQATTVATDQLLAPLRLPESVRLIMRHHWPGPLTLLLPRHPRLPAAVTGGRDTVGIRLPAHPVARALIARSGLPLAAPSANTSGRPSPTRAEHVYTDLNGRIPLILDAGSCQVGVESTVLDCLRRPMAILRPGGVTDQDLRALGHPTLAQILVYRRDFTDAKLEAAPTTPGMKYRHYSPRVPVILFEASLDPAAAPIDHVIRERRALRDRLLAEAARLYASVDTPDARIGLLTIDEPTTTATDQTISPSEPAPLPHGPTYLRQWSLGPWTQPQTVAHRLFDGLRRLDAEPNIRWILVEGLPDVGAGVAVMNRLRKAATTIIAATSNDEYTK